MRTALKRVSPRVIAHRGASARWPEHSIAAYRQAIIDGADCLEPDLVISRDGKLVIRHENALSTTTDIAERPEFAHRRCIKMIDGVQWDDWFCEDFDFDELKSLRLKERFPRLRPANCMHDGEFSILGFDEWIDWVSSLRQGADPVLEGLAPQVRQIALYPETKHPSYFESLGLPLEPALLAALARQGWTDLDAPVWIQSFELSNLIRLRDRTGVKLIQLIGDPNVQPFDQTLADGRRLARQIGFESESDQQLTYRNLLSERNLSLLSGYLQGLGVAKSHVFARVNPDSEPRASRVLQPTDLHTETERPKRADWIDQAHRFGLLVHAWTFRPENFFLPASLRKGDPDTPQYDSTWGDGIAEIKTYLEAGVDGVFADDPASAVAAWDAYLADIPILGDSQTPQGSEASTDAGPANQPMRADQ